MNLAARPGRHVEAAEPCPDCHALPGWAHFEGCDVERCSNCGGQRISCGCDDSEHLPALSFWTGYWPGKETAREVGWFSRFVEGTGWVQCPPTDEGASEDLNSVALLVQRVRRGSVAR